MLLNQVDLVVRGENTLTEAAFPIITFSPFFFTRFLSFCCNILSLCIHDTSNTHDRREADVEGEGEKQRDRIEFLTTEHEFLTIELSCFPKYQTTQKSDSPRCCGTIKATSYKGMIKKPCVTLVLLREFLLACWLIDACSVSRLMPDFPFLLEKPHHQLQCQFAPCGMKLQFQHP